MLDSKLLRSDPAAVAANLARRGFQLDVAAFTALEERRKSAQVESDRVRAERNANAKAVGMAKGKGQDASELLKRAEELTGQLAASDAAIAAVQSEYSLWTRNPEIAVLEECRRIGAALVAFSPLGRGFLAGDLRNPAELLEGDLRRGMPRFQSPNFEENLRLTKPLDEIAAAAGCTRAQLALAWVLERHPHTLVIPGTTRESHLLENCGADAIRLDAATILRLDHLLPPGRALGERYPPATQVENDTEVVGQRP